MTKLSLVVRVNQYDNSTFCKTFFNHALQGGGGGGEEWGGGQNAICIQLPDE